MIRAVSNFQIPGMSWPREMRPVPIAPTLIRLPGDVAPKTEAGTIAGKPPAGADPNVAPPAAPRDFRREVAVPSLMFPLLRGPGPPRCRATHGAPSQPRPAGRPRPAAGRR